MCIKINKIGKQASYRYPISWEAFLDPSDSYFLFADFVDFYTHLTYICICTIFVTFFSASIDGRNLIFGHKLHIDTSYCGKRFLTRQIPASCLKNQQNRQTGSRNLMVPKTLPTIWGTYMKLVTKYQISAINSC
jgi:hypothetical protein